MFGRRQQLAGEGEMGDRETGAIEGEVTCIECGASVKAGAFCRQCGQPIRTTVSNSADDGRVAPREPVGGSGTAAESPGTVTAAGAERVDGHRGTRVGLLAGIGIVGALVGAGLVALFISVSQADEELATPFSEQPTAVTATPTTVVAVAPSTTVVSADISTTVLETTTTVPETTTTVPETTTTSPIPSVLPVALEESLQQADPYRFSFPNASTTPEIPTAIEGFVAYDGSDAAGLTGLVRSSTLRVFDQTEALVPIPEFSAQSNDCSEAFWVLRWTVRNPDVSIVATNELLPFTGSDGEVEDEPWLLPQEAPGGIMGGGICSAPGFQFASTLNGSEATLADVVVEWTYFDRETFPSPANSSSAPCATYSYDVSLPIALCAEGPAVATLQEALGLEPDGLFGPGTERAVQDFQRSAGIAATGVVDRLDWSYIGPADFGVVGPLD